jgi:hypothetical protein
VELIRRCFTEENFSFDGKYYQMKNVNLTPKPVEALSADLDRRDGGKIGGRVARMGYHLAGSGRSSPTDVRRGTA